MSTNSNDPITYVAGFLFDEACKQVLLIEKQKPDWQRGLLNAIGGKVEPGERPTEAMVREFQEETGMNILKWRYFCNLSGDGWMVHFFCTTGDLSQAKQIESEPLCIVTISEISSTPIIPNLNWLIPLALDKSCLIASVSEEPNPE